jgi:hypothetical protein
LSTLAAAIRAFLAAGLTAFAVFFLGIVTGDVLFRMHRISDEDAAWYGLNFLLPALICAVAVAVYRLRVLLKRRDSD